MWAHSYEMMGDELRTRMTPRFDIDGLVPDGSGFLRLVLSKTGMTDATAYDLQTKKNYNAHIATNMPADLTCEGMETWIDTMRRLNDAAFERHSPRHSPCQMVAAGGEGAQAFCPGSQAACAGWFGQRAPAPPLPQAPAPPPHAPAPPLLNI